MRSLIAAALLFLVLSAAAVLAPVVASSDESVCGMCHEDVVAAFQRTGHASAPGWKMSDACQNCHGDGEAHIDAGGDPDSIIRPQLLSPRESSDGCLTCHERLEKHFSARQAIHRLSDVGCIACHNPHLAAGNLLVEEGPGLCSGCHPDVAARFELPRSHPMGDESAACVECHEPHTSLTLRANRALGLQTCERCHFEKVGPFIYGHDTMSIEGCGACHEIHGGANRHLLRHETQVNLCYECHGAAATPGWHSASAYLDKKCTACHSAIHGSNTSQKFLEE